MRWGRSTGLTGLGGDNAFVAVGVGSRVVSALKLRQRVHLGPLVAEFARNPSLSWTGVIRPTLGYMAAPWRGSRHLPAWIAEEAAAKADLGQTRGRHPQQVTGIDAIDERIGSFTSGYNALDDSRPGPS